MKRKILDFSVMKEEISQNNVLKMAELIVFMKGILYANLLRRSRTELKKEGAG